MVHCCPVCAREFNSSSALLKHTENSSCFGSAENVHRGVSMWEQSRSQQNVFTGLGDSQFIGEVHITDDAYNSYSGMWECSLCDRHFNSSRSLHMHINSGTHDSRNNYTCSQCGKGFSRMSALADHARQKHGQSTTHRLTNVLTHDLSNSGTLMLTDGSDSRHEALLRFDGGCRPNPGYGGCGYVLQDVINGWIIERESAMVGAYPATNNVAEYVGLIKGLQSALTNQTRRLRVEGDSKLVIEQMLGNFAVNSYRLVDLYNKAKELETKFQWVTFVHIGREYNSEADALASDAVEERRNCDYDWSDV